MTDELADPIANHLEFLGYKVTSNDDGWQYAIHPRRWNFFIRRLQPGCRLFCTITIGKTLGDVRGEYLEALNRINEKSTLARFTLVKDSFGDTVVRIRAFFQADYEKSQFGTFMDAWHSDLDLFADMPTITESELVDEAPEESEDIVRPS